MSNKIVNTLSVAVGAALLGTVMAANAANPFSLSDLGQGYQTVGDKAPEGWQSVDFPPDLNKYDVVVSNYNGASWPKEFNDTLDARLKENKIGLVIVHAADNVLHPSAPGLSKPADYHS